MEQTHYFAFISHSTKDQKTALWLRNKLVNYNIPTSVRKQYNTPKRIRPVFVYQTDLAGNVLGDALAKELNDSQYLIVICSPNGAKSKYVNDEVRHFIDMRKADKIIPFIVAGTPHVDNPDEECFPPALLELSENGIELRGISLTEQSKQLGNKMGAVVNIIATMLGVRFDTLWDWHRRKIKRTRTVASVAVMAALLLAIAVFVHIKNLKKQGDTNRIISVCEQASSLIDQGDTDMASRLLLSVADLESTNQEYNSKVHSLLRSACQNRTVSWKVSNGYTTSASFSPDGSRIVTTSTDGSISIWDALTHVNKGIVYYQDSTTLRHAINNSSFSPDSRYVVTASEDRTMTVWDAKTLEMTRNLHGHNGEVLAVAFNHDQTLLASASDDGVIMIWETATYNVIKTLRHSQAVNSVVFSNDDKLFASASDDSRIIIWDAQTFKQLLVLDDCMAEIDMVTISPDNRLVAAGAEDGYLRIWEMSTGKCLYEIPSWSGVYYSVDFSPNGQQLLTTIVSMGNTWIQIYDTNTGLLLRQLPINLHGTVKALYSPDGKSVVISIYDNSGRIIVWDIDDGFVPKQLVGHRNIVYSAYYSHDGRHIVTASEDSTLMIWDANTLEEERRSKNFRTSLLSAVYSPDDQHLLIIMSDFEAVMLDVNTGAFILSYAKTILDWSNAMSQDETVFVDPLGNLYNAKTGTTKLLDPSGVIAASVSHNGEMIAATPDNAEGRVITVYNNAGKVIGKFRQEDRVINLAFSHDDKYLAMVTLGGRILVLDVSAMQLEAVYDITRSPGLCAVEFIPDDTGIIYSKDSVVEILDFPPFQELIDQTRERFKDNPLTPEERKMYYLE